MGETHNAEEVIEAFNNVEGIEAHLSIGSTLLVKVMDESAIGQFYGVCRQFDGKRDHTTRNCLDDTVLDSWYVL